MATPSSKAPVAGSAPIFSKSKLREIFNKFDSDGSGSVSTAEMSAMVQMLKLKMTPASIAKMMKAADTDGSGEMDLDEFVTAIRKQMKDSGSDGLASVVTEVGNHFGWLNPLSWFGGSAEDEASKPTSAKETPARSRARPLSSPPASTVRSPGRSSVGSPRLSPNTGKHIQMSQDKLDSIGFTPTHRVKATQALVQCANAEIAADMKREKSQGQEVLRVRQEHFLQRQQDKILKAKQQQQQVSQARELLNYQKRYEGWEMKRDLKKAHAEEEVKKAKVGPAASAALPSACPCPNAHTCTNPRCACAVQG